MCGLSHVHQFAISYLVGVRLSDTSSESPGFLTLTQPSLLPPRWVPAFSHTRNTYAVDVCLAKSFKDQASMTTNGLGTLASQTLLRK